MNELKIIKENYMLVDYNSLGRIANEAIKLLGLEKSQEIREEIGRMIPKITLFEVDNNLKPIREFLIRIDSPTGEFLLNAPREENILGVDAYISYENVVASYLTAIKTHNCKMANKIEPLLRERIFGFVNSFQGKYEYSLLEYIKENGDLKAFLEENQTSKRVRNTLSNNEGYDEYIVYENGEVSIKTVQTLKKKK